MLIQDRIYGPVEIDEPLLIDLINSKAIKRLKGISQFGVPKRYFNDYGYDRYEHSLGVMLLLRKLGAPLTEQVAGLLHDISHTAFSHVYDWVVGSHKDEGYQDSQFEKYVSTGEIPEILNKHNFDHKQIVDLEVFSLLEQSIPDLCADRVDYALREFPPEVVNECLQHLTVNDGQIIFDNYKSAKLFANNFLLRQRVHWGSEDAVSRFVVLSELLKLALKEEIISVQDFLVDDDHVLNKIISSNNPDLIRYLSVLEATSLDKFPRIKETVAKKFRYVDPKFLCGDVVCRLSETDPEFKLHLQKEKEHNDEGIRLVKVI